MNKVCRARNQRTLMAVPLAAALLLAAMVASAAPEKTLVSTTTSAVKTTAVTDKKDLKKKLLLKGKALKGRVAKPSNTKPTSSVLISKKVVPAKAPVVNEKVALRKDTPIANEWITTKTTPKPPAPQAFHAALLAQRSRSMVDFGDGTYGEQNGFQLMTSLQISEKWNTSFLGGYAQDVKNALDSDFQDGLLSFGHSPWSLSESLNFSAALVGVVPLSKAAKLQTLQGGAGVSLGLSVKPGVLISGFTLGFGVSAIRLFHEYETSDLGKMNNAYSSRQNFNTSYTYKKVTASAIFYHVNRWSYKNSLSEAFEHSEELSYAITDNFAAALGHTLAGSALKPNGVDSNVALTDEINSTVYAALTVSY